jgi:hypothetical protein
MTNDDISQAERRRIMACDRNRGKDADEGYGDDGNTRKKG